MSAAANGVFSGRIVIVGASLAGLRAAEALRLEGFAGPLTLIGDEPYPPYDRPPLSKTVLTGWLPAEHTTLPQFVAPRRGVAARRPRRRPGPGRPARPPRQRRERALRPPADRHRHPGPAVAGGERSRARRGLHDPHPRRRARAARAAGPGTKPGARHRRRLHRLRGRLGLLRAWPAGDSRRTRPGPPRRRSRRDGRRGRRPDAAPATASICAPGSRSWRSRATRTDAAPGPPLRRRRARCRRGGGRARRASATSSGWAAPGWRPTRGAWSATPSCRVFDADGVVPDDVFVAGDVARWPHPLFDGQFLAVEHWGNAVRQAATAAHNMVRPPAERRAHRTLPAFWSNQFGNNIKSVGRADRRRRGRGHPGLGPGRSLRRRLRRGRAGRGRGRIQRAALARVLPGADRGAGAVSAGFRTFAPATARPSSSPGRPASRRAASRPTARPSSRLDPARARPSRPPRRPAPRRSRPRRRRKPSRPARAARTTST